MTDWYKTCAGHFQMKRYQEMENKAAALKRELDIQRTSVRQHKDKLQQLHELLASREQEHRYTVEDCMLFTERRLFVPLILIKITLAVKSLDIHRK